MGKFKKVYPTHPPTEATLPGPGGTYHTYDPAQHGGPVVKRSCRDVLFLLLFIAYWVAMVIVAITALNTGDPNKLIYPRDYNDQYCGTNVSDNTSIVSYDLTARPVLYFFDPLDPDDSTTVCIAACPSFTGLATPSTAICKYTIDTTTLDDASLQSEINAGNCAKLIYKSTPILDRCVPMEPLPEELGSFSIGINNKSISVNSLIDMGRDTATKAVSDIKAAWYYLAVAPVAALIIAFIWLVLMRIFSGAIVWLTVILANAALIVGTIFLGFYWWSRKEVVDEANGPNGTGASDTQKWEMWGTLIGLIVVGVVALIVLIMTLVLLKRIRIAIQIIKEAGRAIWAMPLIVLFPIIPFILMIALFAYFLWIALYLATPGGPVTIAAFKWRYEDPKTSHKMEWFHLFGFLWSWAFLIGLSQLTVAGAFAIWYWTLDKRRVPSFPVVRSFYRSVRYHLGSIALGSALIALVQIVRLLLLGITRQVKATQNKVAKYILMCVQCLLGWLQKLIKWINKNAYIEIAIRGRSFCTSASAALGLVIRNVLRLVAVDWVGDFILFLSKIAITVATGVCAYYALQYQVSIGKLTLQFPLIVAVIAGAEAFVVAQIFMGVYEMGIDTIFLCFLEDDERNDGTPSKPYYMSDGLKSILNKKNVVSVVAAGSSRASSMPYANGLTIQDPRVYPQNTQSQKTREYYEPQPPPNAYQQNRGYHDPYPPQNVRQQQQYHDPYPSQNARQQQQHHDPYPSQNARQQQHHDPYPSQGGRQSQNRPRNDDPYRQHYDYDEHHYNEPPYDPHYQNQQPARGRYDPPPKAHGRK
ncbi:hypothetical protein HK097_007273 [Rhizophlyctis rosea]|uniref:DUF580-domain-containing protein n=1 Tax=Rhizophlyctis rosea TaxID=64517 RepID=A0AAD5X5B0_9FUNG|nr:hypothetical protein HK097_007273 [Rhizophlyctis rosea]